MLDLQREKNATLRQRMHTLCKDINEQKTVWSEELHHVSGTMEQYVWDDLVSTTISGKPCKHGNVNCWTLFDIHVSQPCVGIWKWVLQRRLSVHRTFSRAKEFAWAVRKHGVASSVDRAKPTGHKKTTVKLLYPQLKRTIHSWNHLNLVGGLEHFLFFHILGLSSSQLTFIYSEG